MKTLTTLVTFSVLTLSALTFSTPAFAQPGQNHAEHVNNKIEKQMNRAERHDDRLDLAQMQNLLARFDQARASRRPALMSEVDSDVLRALAFELREGRVESGRKANEANRSGQEAMQQRHEAGRDAAMMAPPGMVADGARDARKDMADMREDQLDLVRERNLQMRKRDIAMGYERLAHRHDPRSAALKRSMLNDLVMLAKAEVMDNKKEKMEDKRERHEDRHERREDRAMGH